MLTYAFDVTLTLGHECLRFVAVAHLINTLKLITFCQFMCYVLTYVSGVTDVRRRRCDEPNVKASPGKGFSHGVCRLLIAFLFKSSVFVKCKSQRFKPGLFVENFV